VTAVFVYVTAPSEAEAQKIAAAMVTDRLAACANIIPAMKSMYHWQGKIEQRNETIIIFKTRDALFPALEARVKELHSDTTPCIVALPITAGNDAYMQWIFAETKP
jgi:periplasmic divalent cation tolerance protein